jgi:hypothetical protein
MFDPLRPELRAAITAVDGWEIAEGASRALNMVTTRGAWDL